MIRRTTWIILAVFVVLLGAAWYLQRNKPATTLQATPTPGRQYLFEIQESNIKKLAITNDQGQRLVLGRDASGAWSLEEPKAAATDVGQAESAVTQLSTLSVLNTLASTPQAEASGLGNPSDVITLTMNSGPLQIAYIGKKTPIQNGYYAQLGKDGPVMVLKTDGVDALLRILDSPPILGTPTPTGQPAITPTFTPTVTPQPSPSVTPLPQTPLNATLPVSAAPTVTSTLSVTSTP
ncbi:MAG: hypothetical protein P8Z00_16920 [Anaerolineales bacterium]